MPSDLPAVFWTFSTLSGSIIRFFYSPNVSSEHCCSFISLVFSDCFLISTVKFRIVLLIPRCHFLDTTNCTCWHCLNPIPEWCVEVEFNDSPDKLLPLRGPKKPAHSHFRKWVWYCPCTPALATQPITWINVHCWMSHDGYEWSIIMHTWTMANDGPRVEEWIFNRKVCNSKNAPEVIPFPMPDRLWCYARKVCLYTIHDMKLGSYSVHAHAKLP